MLEHCLERGVTTVDLADVYGAYTAERRFGDALALAPGLRDQLQLVSKCGILFPCPEKPSARIKHYDYTAKNLIASVERSLNKLGTDRLDLLLLHRPSPLLNPIEVAEAFSRLQQQGKVLHFGVSNFTPAQFEALQANIDQPLVTNQIECSLLATTPMFDGTFDQCLAKAISPMIWSPLGGGALFTSTKSTATRVRTALEDLSVKYKCNSAQLAYAWLLRHPSRPHVVLGTTHQHRLEEAIASTRIELELQDWFLLLEASQGKEVP